MSDSSNQFAHRLMSGEAQGLSAGILRGVLSLAEPVYASITSVRNCLYNYHLFRTRSLDRPVFSIGNITTGGTGKTPVVRWLAERLRGQGHRPAILLRGYKQLSERHPTTFYSRHYCRNPLPLVHPEPFGFAQDRPVEG